MKSEAPHPRSSEFDGRRRWRAALAVAGTTGLLLACAAPSGMPPPVTVNVDGVAYTVEQLTFGTWSASAPAGQPAGPEQTAALLRAIQKASNCQITDSSPGSQGAAVSAQVDCGSRLKN